MSSSHAQFQRLKSLTITLTDLLARENALLAERRPQDIVEFQGEKERLGHAYSEEMTLLRQNPDWLQSIEAAERTSLREATKRFKQTLDENRRALLVRKTVSEGIIRSIGEEVASKNRPVQSYSKNAQLGPAMPNYAKTRPAPLTLDKHI